MRFPYILVIMPIPEPLEIPAFDGTFLVSISVSFWLTKMNKRVAFLLVLFIH